MIGEDEGIQWGALLSYNFALSLLIVTTNVVVLCIYLAQKCPLWGTIKGYYIVLYEVGDNSMEETNPSAPVRWGDSGEQEVTSWTWVREWAQPWHLSSQPVWSWPAP